MRTSTWVVYPGFAKNSLCLNQTVSWKSRNDPSAGLSVGQCSDSERQDLWGSRRISQAEFDRFPTEFAPVMAGPKPDRMSFWLSCSPSFIPRILYLTLKIHCLRHLFGHWTDAEWRLLGDLSRSSVQHSMKHEVVAGDFDNKYCGPNCYSVNVAFLI